MLIFKNQNQKLVPVKETSFDLERDIQKLTEANLETIFGLEFLFSEFNLENFWLDSLAFNPETKAFVIIEYKKKQNISVMDQGQTYLNLLLDHKAEALLKYNKQQGKNLELDNINWDQTRVIFIAPEFTIFQKRALHPKLPFELWEVKKYEGNFITYHQIKPRILERLGKPAPALTGRASKEIKVYTEEDIFNKCSSNQKDIMKELIEYIEGLDENLQKTIGKDSISYKYKTKRSFVNFGPSDDKIRIHFQDGNKLEDKKNMLEGRGEYGRYVKINSVKNIPEIKEYIDQAYNLSLKEN